jgi:hypothetical protein
MNNEHIDVVWKALDNHCRDNMTDDEWDNLCYSMAIIEESMCACLELDDTKGNTL